MLINERKSWVPHQCASNTAMCQKCVVVRRGTRGRGYVGKSLDTLGWARPACLWGCLAASRREAKHNLSGRVSSGCSSSWSAPRIHYRFLAYSYSFLLGWNCEEKLNAGKVKFTLVVCVCRPVPADVPEQRRVYRPATASTIPDCTLPALCCLPDLLLAALGATLTPPPLVGWDRGHVTPPGNLERKEWCQVECSSVRWVHIDCLRGRISDVTTRLDFKSANKMIFRGRALWAEMSTRDIWGTTTCGTAGPKN